MAASAGEVALAFQAINRLNEGFEIELDKDRLATYAEASKRGPVGTGPATLQFGLGWAYRLRAKGEFETALSLSMEMQRLARKIRHKIWQPLSNQLALDTRFQNEELERVQPAFRAIESNPKDPDANTKLGLYFLCIRFDVRRGGSHLALSGDPQLTKIGKQEVMHPGNPKQQVELGDLWWSYAERVPSHQRLHLSRRAKWWYTHALPSVSPTERAAIETRLRRVPKVKGFLYLKATIDGTDSIFFTTDHIQWMHAHAGMPTKIQVNGVDWDISKSQLLTNRGVTQILPFGVDVSNVRLTKIQARGSVAIKENPGVVNVVIDDPGSGAAVYELVLTFGE